MRGQIFTLMGLMMLLMLSTGCGSIYRSSDGGMGLMRVHRCSQAAALRGMSHDEGRLAHSGPPPLAGRMHSVRAPEFSEIQRGTSSYEVGAAHLEGVMEGWEPRQVEAMMIPTSTNHLLGISGSDHDPQMTN
jgi:hypothetical protein